MNTSIETIRTRLGARRSPRPLEGPDEILRDTSLSIQEKRALLAAWASDANAVVDAPSLRKLEGGSVAPVDDILKALRPMDAASQPIDLADWRSKPSRKGAFLSYVRGVRSGRDDDDDPPPCPAAASIPIPLRRVMAVAAA